VNRLAHCTSPCNHHQGRPRPSFFCACFAAACAVVGWHDDVPDDETNVITNMRPLGIINCFLLVCSQSPLSVVYVDHLETSLLKTREPFFLADTVFDSIQLQTLA
jgi:hypothetical protein